MAAKKGPNFLDELEKTVKKYQYLSEDKDIMLTTGLLTLDYGNGKRIKVYDDDNNIIDEYDELGVAMGSVNGFTGESSTGKSALAYICAGSIMATYDQSDVHIIDVEDSFDKERFKNLTNLSASTLKKRMNILKTDVVEEMADYIVKLVKEKLTRVTELTIDSGKRNMFNEPIQFLTPTVIIIDSWSKLTTRSQLVKAFDESSKQEYENNMQGATRAKTLNAIIKLMSKLATIANVTFLVVHHTTDVIQAGFISKAAQNMHMGGGKHITGGKQSIYLSNNLIETGNMGKLIANGSRSPNYGVDGFLVGMKVAKSRTNSTGKILEAVFDYRLGGFNRLLTLFHYAAKNEIIQGGGQKYYFESYPEVTFSKKNFEKVARKNPKLVSVLFDECKNSLSSLLSNTSNFDIDDEIDIMDALY